MFKITGLDEAMKKLNDLQRKAKAINQQSVPVSEILTPAFLLRHTPFGSADEMYQASGFKIETPEDFAAIPDQEWEQFIQTNTSYESWIEMQKAAGVSHIESKLLKGLK